MEMQYHKDRKELLKILRGRILDIGCNKTDIHSDIEKITENPESEVYGMDAIMTNYKENVVRADAHRIPFKNEVFDCIFAGEIIEHLIDPATFLKEIERVLKNGGLLVLTTPNINSWVYMKMTLRGRKRVEKFSEKFDHIYAWDLVLLRKLFERSSLNMEIVEMGYSDRGNKIGLLSRFIFKFRPDLAWYIYLVAKKKALR